MQPALAIVALLLLSNKSKVACYIYTQREKKEKRELTPCTWEASPDNRAHRAPVELALSSKYDTSCRRICSNMRKRRRCVRYDPAIPNDNVCKHT